MSQPEYLEINLVARAEVISAIEGQVLTDEQRKRFAEWEAAGLTPEQQRVEILLLYTLS